MNSLSRNSLNVIYGVFSLLAITVGSYWLYPEKQLEQPDPPFLYTEGNSIVNSKTGQSVILKGIISDYFRFGMNYDYPTLYGGLQAETGKIAELKRLGADINIIGLYLARLDKIKQNIQELDSFIDYAKDNDMYVLLAPTGNAFLETVTNKLIDDNKKFFEGVGQNDLRELTELLTSRYGNYSHVLFQLTAEPNITYPAWEIIQKELAAIARKYSDNIIIVSTPYYTPYSYSSSMPVLPYDNIIYSTGGYISRNDRSFVERQYEDILGKNLKDNYPVMVAEFGGNYGGDFSSARDLTLFKDILKEINRANLSYTIYRLSAAFKNDGLALFDIEGNVSPKGKIFIDSFLTD